MDEPRTNLTKSIATGLAMIALLTAGILAGRCSAPVAAQEPQSQPTLDEPVILGSDGTATAQAAIAELEAFLHSVTTTTTVSVQKSAQIEPNFDSGDGSRWDQLAQCETGGNWSTNTGNGFGGGLQFMHQSSYSTWLSFGGGDYAPHPWEASREQQIDIAEKVLASSGWGAWPGCARRMGLL